MKKHKINLDILYNDNISNKSNSVRKDTFKQKTNSDEPATERTALTIFVTQVPQVHISITGWWLGHPSEKYEFVNWDDEIPNISGKIKLMFQTTNQIKYCTHIHNKPLLHNWCEYFWSDPRSNSPNYPTESTDGGYTDKPLTYKISRWYLSIGPTTRWCPKSSSRVQLVYVGTISLGLMNGGYIELVIGTINQLVIGGAPPCIHKYYTLRSSRKPCWKIPWFRNQWFFFCWKPPLNGGLPSHIWWHPRLSYIKIHKWNPQWYPSWWLAAILPTVAFDSQLHPMVSTNIPSMNIPIHSNILPNYISK